MTMSPSINYAEQVLREEAERLARLKEEAVAVKLSDEKSTFAAKTESIVKVNLKDDGDFPTLGKAKGKQRMFDFRLIFLFYINYFYILMFLSYCFTCLGYFHCCTGQTGSSCSKK